MKRSTKKKSGIYSHLSKVFESGSDEDIARARKAYWKAYKIDWKKRHTKTHTYVTLSLTQDEARRISEAAKNYRRGRPSFIKQACLAFLDKRYLVPDVAALGTIRQLLAVNYNVLQRMFEENKVSYDNGMELLQILRELERKVLVELYNPKEIV